MKILRMVAEGKINADEAETLLEALGGQTERTSQRQRRARRGPYGRRPPRAPRPPRGIGKFVTGMEHFAHDLTDSIMDSIEDSFGLSGEEAEFFGQEFDTSPETFSIPPGATLAIQSNSGALTLFGTDEPELKISGALRRHYKVRQEDDQITVKANRFGAALTIHVPRTVERLVVKTNLGEIVGRNFSDTLKETQIQTHTGNIGFDVKTLSEGRIWLKSHTGTIKLSLPEQSACNIQAVAKTMGEIETDLPLDDIERGAGYLKGTLNGGGADVRIATHVGGIFIEASSPTPSAAPKPPIVPPFPAPSPSDADDEAGDELNQA